MVISGFEPVQSAPEPALWINTLLTLQATNQTMRGPLLRIQWLLPELRIGTQERGGEGREVPIDIWESMPCICGKSSPGTFLEFLLSTHQLFST